MNDVRIDLQDVPDETQVHVLGAIGIAGQHHASGVDEATVLPADAYRLAAMLVDEPDELLIALTEHHFNDVHRRLVGNAYAAMHAVFDAHLLQQLVDAPSAAVHDNRVHSDQTQQR